MAPIVSGTHAAAHPTEVPTMRRVTDAMATMRTMKGIERPMLTIWDRIS